MFPIIVLLMLTLCLIDLEYFKNCVRIRSSSCLLSLDPSSSKSDFLHIKFLHICFSDPPCGSQEGKGNLLHPFDHVNTPCLSVVTYSPTSAIPSTPTKKSPSLHARIAATLLLFQQQRNYLRL